MYVNSVESDVTAARSHVPDLFSVYHSSDTSLNLGRRGVDLDCLLCGFSINCIFVIFVRVRWKFDDTSLGEIFGARTQSCSGVLWFPPPYFSYTKHARELLV